MRLPVHAVVVVVGALAGMFALTGVAAAHVEVSAKPARALAENAVVTFAAEAESSSAGIVSVRVVLPTGIIPGDVALVSGPTGWTLTPTADGYTVRGPALGVGKDAAYAIRVRQLPNASSVAFKTLVTYSDGAVDRWIEIPKPGEKAPDNPAPVLALLPAPSAAITTPPVSSPSASSPVATLSAPVPASPGASGTRPGMWAAIGLGAAAALVGLVALVRRRAN